MRMMCILCNQFNHVIASYVKDAIWWICPECAERISPDYWSLWQDEGGEG